MILYRLEMHKYLSIQPCEDDCELPGFTSSNFLTTYDATAAVQKEKESADILTLYK